LDPPAVFADLSQGGQQERGKGDKDAEHDEQLEHRERGRAARERYQGSSHADGDACRYPGIVGGDAHRVSSPIVPGDGRRAFKCRENSGGGLRSLQRLRKIRT